MKTLYSLLSILSLFLTAFVRPSDNPTVLQAIRQTVYADGLGPGWQDWSWASVNLNATAPVHSGSSSIAITFTGGWQGLSLHYPGVDLTGVTSLQFYIHGGSAGGQKMTVYFVLMVNGNEQNGPAINVASPAANTWTQVNVPVSSLNPTSASVTRINWQSSIANSQPTFYVDDIALVDIEDPNAPQLTAGNITPRSAPADGFTPVVVRVHVTDPQGSPDIAAVSVDTGIAGVGVLTLHDDGRSNDGGAGDGTYGGVFTIPPGTSLGERHLLLTAADAEGHTASLAGQTLPVLAPVSVPIPARLPQHMGWGSNAWSDTPADDWQHTSGVPWEYVYQYITYGWDDGSWGPDFVSKFVNVAWADNNVPMVTVYLMLATPPNCGESSTCYAQKLQNASAVAAYLASLKHAAIEAKGTKPVIFNIEPDFYGYMQQLSNTSGRPAGVRANDPSSYPVALNISGYANNLAGFGRYLVDMIHATAPNALVAIETSMWATNSDPQSVTDIQAVQMAQTTGAFIDAAGGAQADALVVEWSDRDAGSGIRPWWDDQDVNPPRPSRAILWESALSSATHKRLFLWQVPVGNMSMNNTCQHYQDNRAAYAFAHARDLADAGIIGVLFGGGDGCQTGVTTDGGFVAAQGALAYARPDVPSGLNSGAVNGVQLALWWNESGETDLWGYTLVYKLQSSGVTYQEFVGRRNAASILLPKAGSWEVRIKAVDAMGNESGLSAPLIVVSSQDALQIFLPLVLH